MWSRKFSGATVLYAFLRYGTLIEKISVLLLASWYMSPEVSLEPCLTAVMGSNNQHRGN